MVKTTVALSGLLARGAFWGAAVGMAGSFSGVCPAAPAAQPAASRPIAGGQEITAGGILGELRALAERGPSAPARSLQEAIGRVLPEVPGAPRCLTPFVAETALQASVSRPLARQLEPILAPPALPGASVLTSPDGSWSIRFTIDRSSGDAVLALDRDANGVPDYVDSVGSALTFARTVIVSRMEYRDPAAAGPLEVTLANLGGRVDGYVVPTASGRSGIVLDSRLLGNDALLRAAVIHQFAHAVLAVYGESSPAWWEEATAAWLEGTAIGSFAHYDESIQISLDLSALGLGSEDIRSAPGRLLWPAYLTEAGGRASAVRAIWEDLDDGLDVWQATEQALALSGGTLEKAFSDFGLWLLLSGERSDGRHFPFAERLSGVPFAAEYASYPATQIQSTPALSPLGTAFVRFEATQASGGMRLRLEGEGPGKFRAQILLSPRNEGASPVLALLDVDELGRGTIGIPWATYREAVLILGNVALGSTASGPAPYSLIASADPTFPFEIVSFRAEPEFDGVRVTWETRSEDGLFGWAVYRSDRPGASGSRLNEFLVPAIGDGDGPVSYQFLDEGVSNGRSYVYRLVGVTHEGLTQTVPETRVDLPR